MADSPTRRGRSQEETDAIIKNLSERFNDEVVSLVSGSGWADYLKLVQSSHQYSANNLWMIRMQKPDATIVKGYNAWQRAGRQVRRGEHGLVIFKPVMARTTEKQEDGTEKKTSKLVGFKLGQVFDVSQTDGPALPDAIVPGYLEGQAPHNMWDSLAKRVKFHDYALQVGPMGSSGVEGFTRPADKIMVINNELSPAHQAAVLAHEVGHVELKHVDDMVTYQLHRGQQEVAAESFAYIISGMFGLDSSQTSMPYAAGWLKTPQDVRKCADQVMKAVRDVTAFLPELSLVTEQETTAGKNAGHGLESRGLVES
jgi:antirestriction protein ArdC